MRLVLCNCKPELAEQIVRHVLIERLVASVTAVPGVQRMFLHEGEIHSQVDTLLMMQTVEQQVQPLIDELIRLSANDTPPVLALSIYEANAPYMRWAKENLNG